MKLIRSLIALAGPTTAAQAETSHARFTFKKYTTNALGRIAFETDTIGTEVVECATDQTHELDPMTLALVYGTVADEIQVVKKADVVTVCTVLAFSGWTTVTNADGKQRVRQAFLFIPIHGTNALGSISGRIQQKFDTQGSLKSFVWAARFQASIPEDIEVIEGQLVTGRTLVPANA